MTRRSLLALLMFLTLAATALVPLAADAASDRDGRSVKKISYGPGIEISRLSGDERKLKGTPRSFKRFVRARLDVLFDEIDRLPRCATAPLVVVDRYHGDGWAHAGEGTYGTCPGGGYNVIYDKTSSGWRPILGSQEARFCQDLAWYGVPAFIATNLCLTEDFRQIPYRPAVTASDSPTASARRVLSLPGGNPIVPAEDVVLPAAEAQQEALIDAGAYLSVEKCLSAAEGGPLAVHLGTSPYGCEVTATYRKGRTESIMMRMGADFVVTELYPIPWGGSSAAVISSSGLVASTVSM